MVILIRLALKVTHCLPHNVYFPVMSMIHAMGSNIWKRKYYDLNDFSIIAHTLELDVPDALKCHW